MTIGNFDGVHRGHQAVVRGVVARARELGVPAVVTTFDPHPMTVIHPDSAPLQLTSVQRRLDLLAELGVDAALVLPFTRELSLWEPREFVERVLVDALHAREVHVGENFRYGHRAAGNLSTLHREGGNHGFAVHAVPLSGDTATWSSTYVRQCLAEGDTTAAAAALGRPHRVEGPVVEGDKRGRELGYPTANLALADDVAIPADGVYAGWLIRADRTRMPAAISIGTNPTFGGTVRRVEAYVLDRDDLELYGEHVGVEFADRLRETITFEGVEPLLTQMATDVQRAREITAYRALRRDTTPQP
ncbi:MAG: bifunctional riboflavin kinase/FAD synthetase [Sporichthyaceae bacterium]|nr:bifunctional riboflavin kinase/FAD synthetase [Sporichthyaceae bacterium]